MADIARHLLISGLVQGVGFRQSMCLTAKRLGVRGWVRNLRSGGVEAQIAGPEPAVIALLDWARRGPPGARVEAIEVAIPELALSPGNGFDCLPTA
jgi:acylphosphatase